MEVVCNEVGDAISPLVDRRACFETPVVVGDCVNVTNNCWVTPLDTASTLFRCIPVYNVTSSGATKCVYPAGITDANDARCVLSETTSDTHVVRSAKPNMLFDSLNTGRQMWGRWFGDLYRAWWVVLVCAVGVSLVMGFAFTILMKYCTGCIVWLTIVTVMLGFAALDIYFYFKGGLLTWDMLGTDASSKIKSALSVVSPPPIDFSSGTLGAVASTASGAVQGTLNSLGLTSQEAFRIIAYIFSAVVIIMLIVVAALRRSITTAIEVIKLGSDAMKHLPSLLLYPPIASIGLAAFLLWWIFVAAALATAGEIETTSLR